GGTKAGSVAGAVRPPHGGPRYGELRHASGSEARRRSPEKHHFKARLTEPHRRGVVKPRGGTPVHEASRYTSARRPPGRSARAPGAQARRAPPPTRPRCAPQARCAVRALLDLRPSLPVHRDTPVA